MSVPTPETFAVALGVVAGGVILVVLYGAVCVVGEILYEWFG